MNINDKNITVDAWLLKSSIFNSASITFWWKAAIGTLDIWCFILFLYLPSTHPQENHKPYSLILILILIQTANIHIQIRNYEKTNKNVNRTNFKLLIAKERPKLKESRYKINRLNSQIFLFRFSLYYHLKNFYNKYEREFIHRNINNDFISMLVQTPLFR